MDIDESGAVNENVGMFEAAVHSRPVVFPEFRLNSIAVVLDGSNQDPTVRAFAADIAKPIGAKVVEATNAKSAAEITTFAQKQSAQLIVLPVPFRLDIGVLKDESLGSVVDMVLVESPCPVLCIRRLMNDSEVAESLANVLLPVSAHPATQATAASWGLGLLSPGGSLSVLAVVDQDAIEEARQLLADATAPELWQPDALSRALTDEIGGLIATIQRRGNERKARIQVEVSCGRPAEVAVDRANHHPSLIVAASDREYQSPAFHLATDMVLGATGPVLVVGSS